MSEKLKRLTLIFMILTFATHSFSMGVVAAEGMSFGDIVINEIAWSGSNDSAGDEWIELYNNTNHSIDLSGWVIEDDGSSEYLITDASIEANSYFLIEDKENSVNGLMAGEVIGLSLANSGDSLMLKNSNGIPIDIVNSDGGAWYAGNSASKGSMERIDPGNFSDEASNWATASFSNGEEASAGSKILGTPGSVNSVYDGSGPKVKIETNVPHVRVGQEFEVSVFIEEASDIFAYGTDIKYDASELKFIDASEGQFLSDGSETAFHYALKNSAQGNLVIAGARLEELDSGASGDAELFRLRFEVLSENSEDIAISFGGGSFLSNLHGEIPASFKGKNISVSDGVVNSVKELEVREGEERFSLEINWEIPDGGADSYIVRKKNPKGESTLVAEVESDSYVDHANILPNIDYEYEIIPIKAGTYGESISVIGRDSRGLTGDNNRDDIVDGRDLESLARSFASEVGDENYDVRVDMNFDGSIDGIDLIDLGVNFANSYF